MFGTIFSGLLLVIMAALGVVLMILGLIFRLASKGRSYAVAGIFLFGGAIAISGWVFGSFALFAIGLLVIAFLLLLANLLWSGLAGLVVAIIVIVVIALLVKLFVAWHDNTYVPNRNGTGGNGEMHVVLDCDSLRYQILDLRKVREPTYEQEQQKLDIVEQMTGRDVSPRYHGPVDATCADEFPEPVAAADVDVVEGCTVQFSGKRSTGESLTYRWDPRDDPSNGDPEITGRRPKPYEYMLDEARPKLTVTDILGRTSTDEAFQALKLLAAG